MAGWPASVLCLRLVAGPEGLDWLLLATDGEAGNAVRIWYEWRWTIKE